jgi:hypothetical protein
MLHIRLAAALLAAIALAGPARAETQIFLLKGNDGYGVDHCLAAGERCGEAAATAICRARRYAQAVNFGRINPHEITGNVPAGARVTRCDGPSCRELVAVTCSR